MSIINTAALLVFVSSSFFFFLRKHYLGFQGDVNKSCGMLLSSSTATAGGPSGP